VVATVLHRSATGAPSRHSASVLLWPAFPELVSAQSHDNASVITAGLSSLSSRANDCSRLGHAAAQSGPQDRLPGKLCTNALPGALRVTTTPQPALASKSFALLVGLLPGASALVGSSLLMSLFPSLSSRSSHFSITKGDISTLEKGDITTLG